MIEHCNSVKHVQCVLLLDDDLAVRREIKLLIQTCHYEVREYSPTDLLCDAQARIGCCLIADYWMPEINGLELLRKLRDTAGWRRRFSSPDILNAIWRSAPLRGAFVR